MFRICESYDSHLDVSAVLAADGDEQREAGLGAPPVRLLPIFQAAVFVFTCYWGEQDFSLVVLEPSNISVCFSFEISQVLELATIELKAPSPWKFLEYG